MMHTRKILLLSILTFLPLAACNNGASADPLQSASPRINVPSDDGQIFNGGGNQSTNGSQNNGGNTGGGNTGGTHGSGSNTVIGGANTRGVDDAPGGQGGPGNPAVPEPTTMFLFGTGLAGLAVVRRRRRREDEHCGE